MAYDTVRDRIVLFGGRGSTGSGAAADLGDTWEFDGTRWTRVEIAGQAIRNVHEMAWDAAGGKCSSLVDSIRRGVSTIFGPTGVQRAGGS